MKSFLHMRVSQHHHLTPQLRSAVRLLHLSTIALKQEMIEQAVLNPMLDLIEDDLVSANTLEEQEVIEDMVDDTWTNLYPSANNDTYHDSPIPSPFTLQDYLRWQISLTPLTELDKLIAWVIIDAINEDGFLTLSTKELQASFTLSSHSSITLSEIEAVRHYIQHLDPIGCAAISLADTLLVQLEQLSDNPHLPLARMIIKENLDLLGKNANVALMRQYHIEETTLEEVLNVIQHLNPKPGNRYTANLSNVVIPDLTVKKIDNIWFVELNPNSLPHIRINQYYASLISKDNNSTTHQFIQYHLSEARWFIKSIQHRQKTLLKVAHYLVDYQKDFLELGEGAMKPLTLQQVAHALCIHESTISRITTQKFIATPRGLFELKYFFSSNINTVLGKPFSSLAIKAMIKKLIAQENPKAPLSDRAIATFMHAQGIPIARRTIAKYREDMAIATSHQRK